MNTFLTSLALIFVVILSGCASTPYIDPTGVLAKKELDGNSRIVIRPYYVNLGTGAVLFSVLMGGGTTRFVASIFDVTNDEPIFLGVISSPGVISPSSQELIWYDVPPGKRILMLRTKNFFGGDFIDFVEIEAETNKHAHVNISQHGMNDKPYLLLRNFPEAASARCLYEKKIPHEDVLNLFKKIGQEAKENRNQGYCLALSHDSIPYQARLDKPWENLEISKEAVKALKKGYFETWKAMEKREPPYDLTDKPPLPSSK
jgi:hypothetical protein